MTENATPLFTFDNSYVHLPEGFYERIAPTPVVRPRLVKLNVPLAQALGLDSDLLESSEGIAALVGNAVPEGAASIAMAYAGHQFGNFVPQLGDGRAILLGEVVGPDGQRRDIHLKGAGQTRFSRRGDGRAALGPVLREYIVSEAMAALGIPATRALAAITTGETVYRETPLPGAVLARVAASHIRVGTFEYFAAHRDNEAVRTLADYAIARHDPEARGADNPYRAFLDAVIARQAELVARWMCVGFIHGVMNTDNTAISGETIDYGPCAFMDTYHPDTVFSSIDRHGRYAYRNQASIAHWNMLCLAETLIPVLAASEPAAISEAEAALAAFGPRFETAYVGGLARKLGLGTDDEDIILIRGLLERMAEGRADFTLVFRRLAEAATEPAREKGVRDLFVAPEALDPWLAQWRARRRPEAAKTLRALNPAVIPRNHLVEEVIQAAVEGSDYGPFETLLAAVNRPFDARADDDPLTLPPRPDQVVHQTFCGT